MSGPPAIGRQLDWCQVCGRKIHRKDLVRTQVKWKSPTGHNYLPYSSYNSSGWSCDAADAGEIAVGADGNYCRTQIDNDNNLTGVGGTQTWDGTGTLRCLSAIDLTGWTGAVFSFCITPWGPYDDTTVPSQTLTVAFGATDADGTPTETLTTWTDVNGLRRLWYKFDPDDLSSPPTVSYQFYPQIAVTSTAGAYWAVSNMMLEKDVTAPGNAIIKTAGTAITTSNIESTKLQVVKVCPTCKERLHKTSELRGTPRREIEAPVVVDVQES